MPGLQMELQSAGLTGYCREIGAGRPFHLGAGAVQAERGGVGGGQPCHGIAVKAQHGSAQFALRGADVDEETVPFEGDGARGQ